VRQENAGIAASPKTRTKIANRLRLIISQYVPTSCFEARGFQDGGCLAGKRWSGSRRDVTAVTGAAALMAKRAKERRRRK
jgi:hypothetical protein